MFATLICGWILTWFDIDELFTSAVNQIFHKDYTNAIYWLACLIIGVIILITALIKDG